MCNVVLSLLFGELWQYYQQNRFILHPAFCSGHCWQCFQTAWQGGTKQRQQAFKCRETKSHPVAGCELFCKGNQAGKEKGVLNFRMIINDKLSGSIEKGTTVHFITPIPFVRLQTKVGFDLRLQENTRWESIKMEHIDLPFIFSMHYSFVKDSYFCIAWCPYLLILCAFQCTFFKEILH